MSDPLVLVVLLSTSVDPTTESMLAATRRALGPEATVLADTSNTITDTDALSIGERVHARAVAVVRWSEGPSTTARLHVHVAPSTRAEWTDQELTFSSQDATSEKGRTVGYTLASMVQRLERERIDEAERPPSSTEARPAPRSPTDATPTRTDANATREPTPAQHFDVFAHGVGVLGGGATSAGASAGLRWWPHANVGFRAAAGVRAGSISEASASTMTLLFAAGPGYRVQVGAFEFGARADIAVLRHAVTRERVVETTRVRWIGAVDLMLEAGWALGPHAGLLAAAGPELAFGTTDVDVGGVRVADIPPVRAVAELGLRIRF